MPFIDGCFILIIGAGGKGFTAADPANHLAVFFGGFNGIDENIVGMVVVTGHRVFCP